MVFKFYIFKPTTKQYTEFLRGPLRYDLTKEFFNSKSYLDNLWIHDLLSNEALSNEVLSSEILSKALIWPIIETHQNRNIYRNCIFIEVLSSDIFIYVSLNQITTNLT